MNILITGAAGFVGTHLVNYLSTVSTAKLHGTTLKRDHTTTSPSECEWHVVDLLDADQTLALIDRVRPDQVFHLAGQAFVPLSFEKPWETIETNVRGTLNLLEAIRIRQIDTRFINVSSADVYGPVPVAQLPITEETPFTPTSPYSVSKIGQDMLAWQYTKAFNIFTVRMRPFNHIGPGQNNRFAAADWAMQIARIERGLQEPLVKVGNLSAARDFTDVRDVVRAYVVAAERGVAGDVFNVCSGQPQTMQHILDVLISMSTRPITVKVDPERFRPVDIPSLDGSYAQLQARTGWQPQLSLEQSLQEALDDCRRKLLAQ